MQCANPLEIPAEDLTEPQLMWIDVIHGVVNQPRFDLRLGDINYVIRNMIAKMVSSSKYYFVSKDAFPLFKEFGLNINDPIRIDKYFYGKKTDTMLEHMIPACIIRDIILESDKTKGAIEFICRNAGVVTIVRREENKKLTTAGLSRKMPQDWEGIGDNPLKRYSAAGVVLSEHKVTHEGPICR